MNENAVIAEVVSQAAEPPVVIARQPSTPSTPSTAPKGVESVEGVEGNPRNRAQYLWQMEAGLFNNFRHLGERLAALGLPLFATADRSGLMLVDGDRVRRIDSAKELAPILIDTIDIHVTKNGKYHGERVPDSTLNNMLMSRCFLSNFQQVEEVVTTPVVLADHTPSQPGYNPQGGILHLGPRVSAATGIETIEKFLDVMEWHGNADRTGAVAALLTVPFRLYFPGGKPLILVSATRSHAGKGTVIEFIRGSTPKAEILYENIDWPMEKALQSQLLRNPEIGVINLDNVRLDSAGGRARIIRSGFLESFITSTEIVLNSPGLKSFRTANKFVVLLNTNEGSLSIDLLNRSLPIRLAPTGDVTQRRCPIGNPKLEFLPAHRHEIEAERWGMIDRWFQAGMPLDESVAHYPMSVWAKIIGGILMVNGFEDFLANYSATRAAADPLREALGILAFHSGNQPRRASELARLAVTQGLAKILLVGADPSNEAACERQMGVTLRPYVGATFTVATASEKMTYLLKKENRRWGGGSPHFRYSFVEISRQAVTEDSLGGLVLEDRTNGGHFPITESEDDLAEYQPEPVPGRDDGPIH